MIVDTLWVKAYNGSGRWGTAGYLLGNPSEIKMKKMKINIDIEDILT